MITGMKIILTIMIVIIVSVFVADYILTKEEKAYLKKGSCKPKFKIDDILIERYSEIDSDPFDGGGLLLNKGIKIVDVKENNRGVYFYKYRFSMFSDLDTEYPKMFWSTTTYSKEAFKIEGEYIVNNK